MHQFLTEMCTCVHISVTKWYIVGHLSDALWDLWDGSIACSMWQQIWHCDNSPLSLCWLPMFPRGDSNTILQESGLRTSLSVPAKVCLCGKSRWHIQLSETYGNSGPKNDTKQKLAEYWGKFSWTLCRLRNNAGRQKRKWIFLQNCILPSDYY